MANNDTLETTIYTSVRYQQEADIVGQAGHT